MRPLLSFLAGLWSGLGAMLSAFYSNWSLIYANWGQPERAALDFNEAIRLDPKLVDAYSSRGLVYSLLGRHEEAQQDMDQALRLGADRALFERQIEDMKRRR